MVSLNNIRFCKNYLASLNQLDKSESRRIDKVHICCNNGYTMVELMLALVVGSVVLAAAYSSYSVIASQYSRVKAISDVQSAGIPAINMISRDLRMAGNKAMNNNLETPYGKIINPVSVVDSGNACCDRVIIIYDKSTTERIRVTYYTGVRNNPTRNALYMDIATYDGSVWSNSSTGSLVTDYVDDFQIVTSDLDSNSDPRIVDVSLIIRSKKDFGSSTTYTKPSYDIGNYNISETDRYLREEFNATINIRNLR